MTAELGDGMSISGHASEDRRCSTCGQHPFDYPAEEALQREIKRLGQENDRLQRQLAGAVSLLRNARLILSDHGQESGDNCEDCREMVAEIDAHLGGQPA